MKLISNFKDYYDYLIGSKYGIDPKCVYERVMKPVWKSGVKEFGYRFEQYRVAVAGDLYDYFYFDGEYYKKGDDLSHLPDSIEHKPYGPNHYMTDTVDLKQIKMQYSPPKRDYSHFSRQAIEMLKERDEEAKKKMKTINDKEECPVLLILPRTYNDQGVKNPKLSDIGFGKILGPEEVFLKIYNWLMREPVIENKQTDKEKIQSHGFDLKTSFRKM
jgi:hypothetical protein